MFTANGNHGFHVGFKTIQIQTKVGGADVGFRAAEWRGGIIHENDIYNVFKEECLGGAAIDLFEQDPYSGPLCEIEKCLLTSDMDSVSIGCRVRMEIEATEEVVRFAKDKGLKNLVPEKEYEAGM